jgi:hypothetical protein
MSNLGDREEVGMIIESLKGIGFWECELYRTTAGIICVQLSGSVNIKVQYLITFIQFVAWLVKIPKYGHNARETNF